MLGCALRLRNSGYRDISNAGHFGSKMPNKRLSSENMWDCSSWDGSIPELMQVPHINSLLLPQHVNSLPSLQYSPPDGRVAFLCWCLHDSQEVSFCLSVMFSSCGRVLSASRAGQGESCVLEQCASGNLVCSQLYANSTSTCR